MENLNNGEKSLNIHGMAEAQVAERPAAFAFDSPPLVTPQPVFLQPHYAGGLTCTPRADVSVTVNRAFVMDPSRRFRSRYVALQCGYVSMSP